MTICHGVFMICAKCNSGVPPFIVVNGRKRKTFWKRRYCFKCSPWGSKNNQKLELQRLDGQHNCLGCGNLYLPKLKRRSGKPRTEGRCKICLNREARERRTAIKKKCVEYFGGCCSKCRYNKCLAALDFHHKDPSTKDFEIGRKKLLGFDKLKPELDKCILLCRNCHAEEHEAILVMAGSQVAA